MSTSTYPVTDSAVLRDAEVLARRALAVALNVHPGSLVVTRSTLGEPDPRLARIAIDVLEQRSRPTPEVDLAVEILERCARTT
jgi:hypothetical protein